MKKTLLLLSVLGMAAGMANAETPVLAAADGQIGGHDYVDLGLPSGLLWATCNLGAETPYEGGVRIAWGETQTKESFTAENYAHYVETIDGGAEGNWVIVKDLGKNISGTEYDAATALWGEGWRMPTSAEIMELMSYCAPESAHAATVVNGELNGMLIGDRLFFPATDDMKYTHGSEPQLDTKAGAYWAANIDPVVNPNPGDGAFAELVYLICPGKAVVKPSMMLKSRGMYIRPVHGTMTDSDLSMEQLFGSSGWSGLGSLKAEASAVSISKSGNEIRVSGTLGADATLTITDIAGRTLLSAPVADGGSVTAPALSQGIYVVSLTEGNRQVKSLKMVFK